MIKLDDFRGKAVLVNFLASWCVPCRAEAVALENAWQKYKDKGVVFIGVNIQDKKEDAGPGLENRFIAAEFLRDFSSD